MKEDKNKMYRLTCSTFCVGWGQLDAGKIVKLIDKFDRYYCMVEYREMHLIVPFGILEEIKDE